MVLTLNSRRGGGVIVPPIAPISGRYYGHRSVYGGTGATLAVVPGNLFAAPFWTPVTFTANQIALNITAAAAAGKLLRLGLYAATPAGLPGALLVDSGALPADVVGVASATISQVIAAGRLYYLAMVSDGTPTATTTTGTHAPFGGVDATETTSRPALLRSFTFAALPDPWGTPTGYSGNAFHVALRAV